MCRVKPQFQSDEQAPAACLIKLDNRLIAIQHNNSTTWSFPQQRRQTNLSAQCSAHLAVWKDTGLNVEVGKLLFTSKTNTQFYACQLSDDYAQALDTLDVLPWASRTVTKVALVDPFSTQYHDWDKNLDLIKIRKAFTQLAPNVL
jgi:hypothetical protein